MTFRSLPLTATILPSLLALLAWPGALGAQGWAVDAAIGQIAQPSVPGSVASTGVSLGARYEGPQWLYLTGGLPFDATGPMWGALGAGARLTTPGHRAAIGFDAGGHTHGYRDAVAGTTGGGVTVEAMPLLAVAGGPARLELRTGLQHHTSSYAGTTASRTLHASDVRASAGSAAFRAFAEARYARAEEGDYPYAGGGFEAALGTGAVWAHAGSWLSDSITTPVWGAGARLQVAGQTEVFASLQQETNDPLFRNAPRRSWSVGVSRRLGRVATAISAPVVPERLAGGVTFRIPAAASPGAPSLGGDFNEWQPAAMHREGDSWVLTLPLRPGSYRYAFRGADGEWFVPQGTPGRTDDGFGGVAAVVIVP
jgi:hypothetical protein